MQWVSPLVQWLLPPVQNWGNWGCEKCIAYLSRDTQLVRDRSSLLAGSPAVGGVLLILGGVQDDMLTLVYMIKEHDFNENSWQNKGTLYMGASGLLSPLWPTARRCKKQAKISRLPRQNPLGTCKSNWNSRPGPKAHPHQLSLAWFNTWPWFWAMHLKRVGRNTVFISILGQSNIWLSVILNK